MSKLPKQNRFLDLSDYGRPIAIWIAQSLKGTQFTPIHMTITFIISGILSIICMILGEYWAATFFLATKSILDAADGELARVNDTPSYIGRYFDSIADIILNVLFLVTICIISNGNFIIAIIAFFCLQLQGTLYNYYYVILRDKYDGDTTSRIFENQAPKALSGEKQSHVNLLFRMYKMLYYPFDKLIHWLDKSAVKDKNFPKWFMSAVSIFGLGFQLLLIGVLLVVGLKNYTLFIIIALTIFIPIFIITRKLVIEPK